MTTIWALKDSLSGEYLTKHNALQRLSTTTRTFQKEKIANKVADNYYTYFWMAIKEKTYGQRHIRIDTNDKEFKDYVYKLYIERHLEPVKVSIYELYNK